MLDRFVRSRATRPTMRERDIYMRISAREKLRSMRTTKMGTLRKRTLDHVELHELLELRLLRLESVLEDDEASVLRLESVLEVDDVLVLRLESVLERYDALVLLGVLGLRIAEELVRQRYNIQTKTYPNTFRT